MTPDLINASFELVGSYFTWRNAHQLYREKETKGVYWPMTLFFAVFGAWSLVFYPSINQMLSFYAGIVLVSGNFAWVVLAVFYKYSKPMEIT